MQTKGLKNYFLLSVFLDVVFDLGFVFVLVPHLELGGLWIQWVRRIGVQQKLWEEDLKNIEHIVHGRPRLVYYIQAY